MTIGLLLAATPIDTWVSVGRYDFRLLNLLIIPGLLFLAPACLARVLTTRLDRIAIVLLAVSGVALFLASLAVCRSQGTGLVGCVTRPSVVYRVVIGTAPLVFYPVTLCILASRPPSVRLKSAEYLVYVIVFVACLNALTATAQAFSQGALLSGVADGSNRALGILTPLPTAVLEAYTSTPGRLFTPDCGNYRGHGLLLSHNTSAILMVMALGLYLGTMLRHTKVAVRTRDVLILGLLALGVASTYSRGGLIGLMAVSVLWALASLVSRQQPWRWRVAQAIGPLLVTGLVVGLFAVLIPCQNPSITAVGDQTSGLFDRLGSILAFLASKQVADRVRVWQFVVERIADSPFLGYGTSYFPGREVAWTIPWVTAHNLFLDLAYFGGVPYAMILAILLVLTWVKAWLAVLFRRQYPLRMRALALGSALALTELFIHGMLEAPLSNPGLAPMIMGIAGLGGAVLFGRNHGSQMGKESGMAISTDGR